jgi:transcriptional regulator with XRE-family HTH domain
VANHGAKSLRLNPPLEHDSQRRAPHHDVTPTIHRKRIFDALRNVERTGPKREPVNVGRRLRELRNDLNREEAFSQSELASRSDIKRQRLNGLESGRDEVIRWIRLDELVVITDNLGVRVDIPFRRKSKTGMSAIAPISEVIDEALSLNLNPPWSRVNRSVLVRN